jgi:hypothetical protein
MVKIYYFRENNQLQEERKLKRLLPKQLPLLKRQERKNGQKEK